MFRDNALFWGTFYVVIVLALVVSVFDIDTAPVGALIDQLATWAHDPSPLIVKVRELFYALLEARELLAR